MKNKEYSIVKVNLNFNKDQVIDDIYVPNNSLDINHNDYSLEHVLALQSVLKILYDLERSIDDLSYYKSMSKDELDKLIGELCSISVHKNPDNL